LIRTFLEKIIIAAVAKNNIIGKNGQIPWHSKEELKHFKNTTMSYPIIMGRKTFESIGKPLKGRENIVITRNEELKKTFKELAVFDSLKRAYEYCEKKNFDKIFIIGGGKIYSEAINDVDKLIITFMNLDVEGDTYFPQIDENIWKITEKIDFEEFSVKKFTRK
jgi:dihydrofolate reductase